MKKIRFGLILVVVSILLLVLTSAALAEREDSVFNLDFYFKTVDWENFYAVGEFSLFDPFEDNGKATIHWSPKGQKSATMIFDSDKGSFVAIIDGSEPGTENCSTVRFNIYSGFGTGEYENLGANGDATFCSVDESLTGSLDGVTRTPPGWVTGK